MSTRILIIGTGLIGTSIALALKGVDEGFDCVLLGYDADPLELGMALELEAIDEPVFTAEAVLTPGLADIYVLATPVMGIMDWLQRLAPVLTEKQLVTDVGSTKREIVALARTLYNEPGQPRFLPGHPMAGKESGGAGLGDSTLFVDATWLFTPWDIILTPLEAMWRSLVAAIGAKADDLKAEQHDEVCAWVSHLPQLLSTALAALLQDTFAHDPDGMAAVQAIGGRALRETTRLGASPYSMWRDVALTNTENVAATLHALEQRLAHLRENLRTPQLREEFSIANRFRSGR